MTKNRYCWFSSFVYTVMICESEIVVCCRLCLIWFPEYSNRVLARYFRLSTSRKQYK
jgi:hypothetical protein